MQQLNLQTRMKTDHSNVDGDSSGVSKTIQSPFPVTIPEKLSERPTNLKNKSLKPTELPLSFQSFMPNFDLEFDSEESPPTSRPKQFPSKL